MDENAQIKPNVPATKKTLKEKKKASKFASKQTVVTKKPRVPSARGQAHALLQAILHDGKTVDEAIAHTPLVGSEPDQRFVMLLLLTVLQHVGQLDAVIGPFLDKPLPPKRLMAINALRMGAAQLLLLDTPAHAAVNESVALLKNTKDFGFAGLVNAVLQKISREKPALPSSAHNLPEWLRTRWEQRYGADAMTTMAQVALERAPLDVHSATDMDGAARIDAHIIRFRGEHPSVEALPGYKDGAFFVQDVAASYPVRMLGDVKDLQVLDMCAAPGGKTMQLIQAGAYVTALDRSPARMRRVKENLKRMGLQANTVVADALDWQPTRKYDAILLDAPCTATGTWRRHPEVVQLLKPHDIAQMVEIQRALMLKAWEWLKPGGKMVYCVCSLEPEEGDEQAAWFMRERAEAVVQTPRYPLEESSTVLPMLSIPPNCLTPEGYLRTTPAMMAEQGGMDGFFGVCWVKRSLVTII